MDLKYIDELRGVIRHLHGAEARYLESVPIKETFQVKTIWEGLVEVFALIGHSTAPKVYAWSHEIDDPQKPRRHVTVLHIAPILSAEAAVRADIVQQLRSSEPEDES
jgi:hypothetical protein